MIRFIQVIFSAKQKFNKQAKAAITNTNLSNSRKMRGKTNNNIYIYIKCVKQLSIYIYIYIYIYISYYRQKIYITAGEKVTKITRRYSGSSLDNPVPNTFPRLEILEYGTKQQTPDNSNSTCLHGRVTTTAIKEGCSNQNNNKQQR